MAIDGIHLPVATYNAVAMNVDASGEHVQMMQLVRGLNEAPSVRGIDTIIPGNIGRAERSRVIDNRIIELRGFIIGQGATPLLQVGDTRTRLTALSAAFAPTLASADLVIDLEDGVSTATISCRPLNIVLLDYPEPVFRPFSIELEAIEGEWVIA